MADPETQWVCRHCGGASIRVDVEVTVPGEGWAEVAIVADDTAPDGFTHTTGDVQEIQTIAGDVEIDGIDRFACDQCDRGAALLADLVESADPDARPCGRCDHGRAHHTQPDPWLKPNSAKFTRLKMPCEHPGCDCHDYYDLEIANAGQDPKLLQAVRP